MNRYNQQASYRDITMSSPDIASAAEEASSRNQQVDLRLIKASFRMRERRRNLVRDYKIDDAAWWMLLDLYQAHANKTKLYVSALCANAGTSATSALRRLEGLIDAGLAARLPDTEDSRRIYIVLTACGLEATRTYLSHLNTELFAALAPDLANLKGISKSE